jgi:hypothetical protein
LFALTRASWSGNRDGQLQIAGRRIISRLDLGPGQRVVEARFAEGLRIRFRKERNIRQHAAQLSRTAIDAEELRNGHFHVAQLRLAPAGDLIEIDQGLHGAFTETPFAQDQSATIVLDRRSKDLRGRRRPSIDQDTHGPFHATPAWVSLSTTISPRAVAARPVPIDEQAGELDRPFNEPPPLLRRSISKLSTFFSSSPQQTATSRAALL